MDDKIIDFLNGNYGVEFIGPFIEEWKVSLHGYRVPKLAALLRKDGNIMLSLDERFLIEGSREEVSKWIHFVANAMAIGAGYSCYGENSVKDPNPFKAGMVGLSELPTS